MLSNLSCTDIARWVSSLWQWWNVLRGMTPIGKNNKKQSMPIVKNKKSCLSLFFSEARNKKQFAYKQIIINSAHSLTMTLSNLKKKYLNNCQNVIWLPTDKQWHFINVGFIDFLHRTYFWYFNDIDKCLYEVRAVDT